jgi:protein TonB
MFEAGLIESRGEIRTKTRWTLMVSIIVQGALLAAMIVLPLLHPELLHVPIAREISAPPVFTPPPPVVVQRSDMAPSSGPSAPQAIEIAANVRPVISDPFAHTRDLPPTTAIGPMTQTGMPSGVLIDESSTGTNVAGPGDAPKRGPLHVSQGVMEGRLVVPITPEYPRIAVSMGMQGTVVVEATISATGVIENAHAVSGPMILRTAAEDAVRRARYEPYKLNGEAVSVETTVNIVFHLGRD